MRHISQDGDWVWGCTLHVPPELLPDDEPLPDVEPAPDELPEPLPEPPLLPPLPLLALPLLVLDPKPPPLVLEPPLDDPPDDPVADPPDDPVDDPLDDEPLDAEPLVDPPELVPELPLDALPLSIPASLPVSAVFPPQASIAATASVKPHLALARSLAMPTSPRPERRPQRPTCLNSRQPPPPASPATIAQNDLVAALAQVSATDAQCPAMHSAGIPTSMPSGQVHVCAAQSAPHPQAPPEGTVMLLAAVHAPRRHWSSGPPDRAQAYNTTLASAHSGWFARHAITARVWAGHVA
jgi:hypothetical protein